MSKGTSTPGPWAVGKSAGGVMTVVCKDSQQPSATAIAFTVCREVRSAQKAIKRAEADARLIALAPTMKNALLKVRRWRQVEHDLDEATVDGRPELADLMRECPRLESEIDAVIDQIEEGQG